MGRTVPRAIGIALILLTLGAGCRWATEVGGPRSATERGRESSEDGSGEDDDDGRELTVPEVLARVQAGDIVRVNDVSRARVVDRTPDVLEVDIWDEGSESYVGVLAMAPEEIRTIGILEPADDGQDRAVADASADRTGEDGEDGEVGEDGGPDEATADGPPEGEGEDGADEEATSTDEGEEGGDGPSEETGDEDETAGDETPAEDTTDEASADDASSGEETGDPGDGEEEPADEEPADGTDGSERPEAAERSGPTPDEGPRHQGHVVLRAASGAQVEIQAFEPAPGGGTSRFVERGMGIEPDATGTGEEYAHYVSRGEPVVIEEGDRVVRLATHWTPPEEPDARGVVFEEPGIRHHFIPSNPPAYTIRVEKTDGSVVQVTTSDALERRTFRDEDVSRYLWREPVAIQAYLRPEGGAEDDWERVGTTVLSLGEWDGLRDELDGVADELATIHETLAWYARDPDDRSALEINVGGEFEWVDDPEVVARHRGTAEENRTAWEETSAEARRILREQGIDAGSDPGLLRVRGLDVGSSLALTPPPPLDLDLTEPPSPGG